MKDETSPTVVILGATGDLTRRLLLPALYRLHVAERIPQLRILGCAVEDWSRERFQGHVEKSLREFGSSVEPSKWEDLAKRIDYRSGDLTPAGLKPVAEAVRGPAVFYLALPPGLFGQAAKALGVLGLARDAGGWRRLVVEKPFGRDLDSAGKLRRDLHEHWEESQVFRIDHFLGKETVQNLLVFRFANRFLEPLWNTGQVEQVQITVAESLGLEGRYRYYDGAGALRDMIQNHLMQLFTLCAIAPPSVWDADVLREHKVEVLRAVRPIPPQRVGGFAARGQYGAGHAGGRTVPGYLEEPGIPADSCTETFAAIKLFVDNWRWKGVPFYLRSGKRLGTDLSEIAIKFRDVPAHLFREAGLATPPANWIVFRIRPDECIDLIALAKRPGLELEARPVTLSTPYRAAGEREYSAYEQLLLDVLEDDRTHFLRYDEVEWAWRVLAPVLEAWREGTPESYAAGSDGPQGQKALLEPGHVWRPIAAP